MKDYQSFHWLMQRRFIILKSLIAKIGLSRLKKQLNEGEL